MDSAQRLPGKTPGCFHGNETICRVSADHVLCHVPAFCIIHGPALGSAASRTTGAGLIIPSAGRLLSRTAARSRPARIPGRVPRELRCSWDLRGPAYGAEDVTRELLVLSHMEQR